MSTFYSTPRFSVRAKSVNNEEVLRQTKMMPVSDLVVVGEGFSGLCTALSAAEQGLNVSIVTASKEPVGRGGAVFASYSRVLQEAGYQKQEVENFFLEEFSSQAYSIDQRKWYSFYNHSEEAMNWIIDHLDGSGIEVVLEISNTDDVTSPSNQPAGTHGFMLPGSKLAGSGIKFALKVLEEKFKKLGGKVYNNCVAKQLLRGDDDGRVFAVIAENADGEQLCFVADKAVVLATGDFSANREMMQAFCPAYAEYFDNEKFDYDAGMQTRGLYKGEGHLMALEVGAAWQRTYPNAVMIQGSRIGSHMPNGSHRGLRLNVRGERFCNEDCAGAYTAITVLREPEQKAWGIWDANYAHELTWYAMGGKRNAAPMTPEEVNERWEMEIRAGKIVKADSLSELLEKIGLPKEHALEEIERYNAFCRAGYDADFHKKAKYLQEISRPPFYAGIMHEFRFLTVLGGPRTNHHMQICDANDRPIPGLYGVGTLVGDMFSNFYNYRMAGHNYGSCMTFGYLTGKYIAGHE